MGAEAKKWAKHLTTASQYCIFAVQTKADGYYPPLSTEGFHQLLSGSGCSPPHKTTFHCAQNDVLWHADDADNADDRRLIS